MKSRKRDKLINRLRQVFASRLAALRQALNMSQADLGKQVSIDKAEIVQFETGAAAPSFDVLCRLADALNADLDYLIGRVNSEGQSTRATVGLLRHAKKLKNKDMKILTNVAKVLAKGTTGWW